MYLNKHKLQAWMSYSDNEKLEIKRAENRCCAQIMDACKKMPERRLLQLIEKLVVIYNARVGQHLTVSNEHNYLIELGPITLTKKTQEELRGW